MNPGVQIPVVRIPLEEPLGLVPERTLAMADDFTAYCDECLEAASGVSSDSEKLSCFESVFKRRSLSCLLESFESRETLKEVFQCATSMLIWAVRDNLGPGREAHEEVPLLWFEAVVYCLEMLIGCSALEEPRVYLRPDSAQCLLRLSDRSAVVRGTLKKLHILGLLNISLFEASLVHKDNKVSAGTPMSLVYHAKRLRRGLPTSRLTLNPKGSIETQEGGDALQVGGGTASEQQEEEEVELNPGFDPLASQSSNLDLGKCLSSAGVSEVRRIIRDTALSIRPPPPLGLTPSDTLTGCVLELRNLLVQGDESLQQKRMEVRTKRMPTCVNLLSYEVRKKQKKEDGLPCRLLTVKDLDSLALRDSGEGGEEGT